MSTTYTALLGLAQPADGELYGVWGDVVNASLTALVEDAIANTATQDVTSADWTLSITGSGLSNQARMAVLIPTGTPGVTRSIIAPAHTKTYHVVNSSNAKVVLKGASTTGVSIPAGASVNAVWDGSDFVILSHTANLLGGSVGTIPYQSAADTTAYTTAGALGQILTGNGSAAPRWSSVGTAGQVLTSAGAAIPVWGAKIANISGGTGGQVLYQTAIDTTSYVEVGTVGQVLTSNAGSAPTWGDAITNIAGGTANQVVYQSSPSHTNFVPNGASGQVLTSNGTGLAPTWQTTTGMNASNIANGAAGQLMYQVAPNLTAFMPTGVAGQILVSSGTSAPAWGTLLQIYTPDGII